MYSSSPDTLSLIAKTPGVNSNTETYQAIDSGLVGNAILNGSLNSYLIVAFDGFVNVALGMNGEVAPPM